MVLRCVFMSSVTGNISIWPVMSDGEEPSPLFHNARVIKNIELVKYLRHKYGERGNIGEETVY